MRLKRAFGILMHPTSLPGKFGIGDLGDNAFKFVDQMKKCGAKLWQVMPLGPTGFGDSPYACFSALAGNPLILSPEKMGEDGILSPADLKKIPDFPEEKVDFGPVINFKYSLYRTAYANFTKLDASHPLKKSYTEFRSCPDNSWADDFALFMALKDKHNGAIWSTWERGLASREPKALDNARKELASEIDFHRFLQFYFVRQWLAVKGYANSNGIEVIGDVPIFVAYDSADVWTNPGDFLLDANGRSTAVAGVPPDYFSKTGQLWGNPLYRWDAMEKDGFKWWIERFRTLLRFVDIIRIDHFRGFEAYWRVPAGETTAINGEWIKAPGEALFRAVEKALGRLPIIAEDLGVITPEVEKLRDGFGFAGMKILQFGFDGDPVNKYLPHNFVPNSVVYTGTHDNETTAGWYGNLSAKNKKMVREYIAGDENAPIHMEFVRLAISSVSDIALVPVQDIIGVGDEGRMNTPGKPAGNWSYRFKMKELGASAAKSVAKWCAIYGR